MAGELLGIARPWSIEDICFAGRCYRIPALSAARWLEVISGSIDTWGVLPGLLEGDDAEEELLDAMESGALTVAAYTDLIYDVITQAAGRDWWVALQLLANADSDALGPATRGELILNGVDPARVGLSALLDAIYFLFVRGLPPDSKQKFDNLISTPPPGIQVKIDRAKQRAAWEAVMASGGQMQ